MTTLYYFSLGKFQGYRNTTGSMQYLRSPELTYFTTENSLLFDYQCPISPSTQLRVKALLLDGSMSLTSLVSTQGLSSFVRLI